MGPYDDLKRQNAKLRDMLAGLHFEALGFPRREGSPFDMAMAKVEKEFSSNPNFPAHTVSVKVRRA